MHEISKLVAAFVATYLIISLGFCSLASVVGAEDILPVEPPLSQVKDIHIMTALERSEILIDEIYAPPEMARIGTPKPKAYEDVEPHGWLAYVTQEITHTWPGAGYAYQGM